MKKVKAMIVVGARPNFMKASPLIRAMKKSGAFKIILLHTGQHYDFLMSKSFFKNLDLPNPDIYLAVGSDTSIKQTAKIMISSEEHLLKHKPDVVIVVGDVNSTLALALCARKLNIPLAHVESGLRSRDMKMPEEINRILTDRVSDLLFTTEKSANLNLKKEGIDLKKIFFVGNTMIDSLFYNLTKIKSSAILQKLHLKPKKYAVLTLHRPSNVDHKKDFLKILKIIDAIQNKLLIVFVVHPRTKKQLKTLGLISHFKKMPNVVLTPSMGYIDFMKLVFSSSFVLTDSGGIQEESTALNVPCITLRENTERPVTSEIGTNVVVGTNPQNAIFAATSIILGKKIFGKIPKYWDGRTSERITRILKEKFLKK